MNRLQKQWVVPSEVSSTLLMHMQLPELVLVFGLLCTYTVVLEILRSVKAGPKCITRDTEVCESIAIIRKRIAIVRGD